MFRLMKLKPPHGWRAAWWEFSIVTLGVLLALGAEQTIRGIQAERELGAVRQALNNEARRNLTAVHFREQLKPCIDRRLGELRKVLERHKERQPLGITAPIGTPTYWAESTGTWQIALSGEALGNMPLEEKLAYSDAFDTYQAFTRLRDDENVHWRTISLLDEARLLGDEDWPTLHRAFGEARAINNRFTAMNEYILKSATLGEPVEPLNLRPAVAEGLRQFCQPMIG